MLITLNHLKSSLQAVKTYINNVLPKKVSDLVDDSGHYIKPSGGIPASDLADGVIPVEDVQVNGTSILSNGVANVLPMAYENYGVARVNADYGIYNIASTSAQHGVLYIQKASDLQIKEGTGIYRPIVPSVQNASTFYGLAKAAGDTTQSVSSNAVGTYTDEAKVAIKSMLDITTPEAVGSCVEYITDSSVTIVGEPNTRYVCGEVTSIDITPPAVGTIDVTFTSGSTIAILTLPSTVKMPEWWTGVESGYTYELVITDGVYAGVMTWPQ